MNPSNLERLIATAAELGATIALQRQGLAACEISEREAFRTYGVWLRRAVEDGRIIPTRTGVERNSKKLYNVASILALKASDEARAELKIR